MKKIFISLLVGAMAATLTGCVNNGVEHDNPGTSTSNNNASTSGTSTGDTSASGSYSDGESASDGVFSSINISSATTSDQE